MMINTTHAIAGGILTLSSLVCPTPPEAPLPLTHPKPACTLDTLLIASLDAETPCDLAPPQILAARIDDDPGPIQATLCHDAGGSVFHDPVTDAFYCINIDY